MAEMTQDPPALCVDVLGALRVRVGEIEVPLRAPMHRALLALLATEPNRVVPTETLIDELWGTEPPEGARGTLQSYVSVLRRKFRDAGLGDRELLATQAPGYVLKLGERESDVLRFRDHIALAREHLAAAGSNPDVTRALDRAIAEVGDPVLPDLDHLAPIRAFVVDIEERRTWAIEQKVEIELGAGRASDVVPMLHDLVERRPLEERMTGLHMRALYQSGRQADALAAYQNLRTRLVEQLGIEPSPELRAIERDILEAESPDAPGPTSARLRRPTPVPHATTSLVGRSPEIGELSEALQDRRLVTVTGPGGCGKTRVVAETALTLTPEFDQVAWVELNTVEPGASLPQVVAAALGMVPRQQDGLLELVADELASVQTLLVFDNCEHLVEDVALIVEKLLAMCADLTVLTSSREQLMVGGEYTLALTPLAFASPLELSRARHDTASDAAQMFIDRAGLDTRTEVLDLPLIEGVCAQLDGIPLAIELAAPLLATMTLDEMADRLLDRFKLLASQRRTVREQHRTLRAVVEWSYDLLDEDERRTFEALSVFPGPFTMDAAAEVADAVGADGETIVPRLVRKSVVLADTQGATTRYRLTETIRAYGAEQLAHHNGVDGVQAAFVSHYAHVAQHWSARQQLVTITTWLTRLGPEIPNLRAAVDLAQQSDPDKALVLIDAFQWYYNYLGDIGATRAWLRELTATQDLALEQRAMVRVCQAALANFGGDYGVTPELAEDALEAARELEDPRRINAALIMRGTTATFEGNAARAAECFVESSRLSHELGDAGGIAASMVFWGIAHRRNGSLEEAQECFENALAGFSELADDRGLALTVGNLGRLAQQRGDLALADELTANGLDFARRSLDPMVCAQVALFRGHTMLDLGRNQEALEYLELAVEYSNVLGNRTMSSAALEWMVILGGAMASHVTVIDAFTRVRRNAPGTASPRPEWDAAVAEAVDTLPPDELASLSRYGEALTMDEALVYARNAASRA